MSTPAMPDDAALQVQLRILEMQTKAARAQVDNLTAKLKKLKEKKNPSAADKKRIAVFEVQLKQATVKATSLGKRQADTRTKYYESTGQYEKLLEGDNRDAFMAVSALFKQYGLGSLAGKIYEYVKNGYKSDVISLLLQDSPEYKKRFAANEMLKNSGAAVLTAAEYIGVETSFREIMRQSGLPTGFYDSTDDFTNWIGSGVSPTELKQRVDLATQATALANPAYKAALQQMGLSDGELTAYFLDANRALPILQKNAATAAIGAEAIQRGLAFDKSYSEDLATAGVSREQAATGYAKIADEFSDLKTLGQVYGGGWTQRMAEEDAFVGGTSGTNQRDKLIGREKGAFSGAAGSARAGLAQSGGAR